MLTLMRVFLLTEQDDGLEKLEETVISTKHIALAVNEELDLHARLIVWIIGSWVVFIFDFVISWMTSAISISLTISCYLTLQDDLDQHVDVTDSRLRVNIQLFSC